MKIFSIFLVICMNDFLVERPQSGPQEMFCGTKATVAIAGGGFYGGKSIGLILEAGRNVFHQRYRGTIFRRTYPQITDAGGLADIAEQIYRPLKAIPTDNRTLWTFPSGALIKFNHMQHEQDMVNYRSSQFCFLGIDQLEEFPEEAFFYLRARNRPAPGYEGPAYCRCTCNAQPGWLADFIQWWWDPETGYPLRERSSIVRHFMRVKGNFVWQDKPFKMTDTDGRILKSISVTLIPSTAKDNPKGLEQDPDYESNIASMDMVSAERYGKSNWKISYAGGMFDPTEFKFIEYNQLPKELRKLRYWDFAASEVKENKDPNYTVGALCGEAGGDFYIIDANDRFREMPGYTIDKMLDRAKNDGVDTAIRWEEEKGSAGKFNTFNLTGKLIGYDAQSDPVVGDKVERAKPLAAAVHNGRVFLVKGKWNNTFIAEAGTFPKGKKDQIDAVTGAMKCLCTEKRVWDKFTLSKTIDFKINWEESFQYSIMYGAYFQAQNSAIYFLAAIWDSFNAKLFVFDEKKWERPIADIIAAESISTLRLRAELDMRIVGNETLIQEIGKKSTARVLADGFERHKISWTPRVPVMFEIYGAISYVGNLFAIKDAQGLQGIVVHKNCVEAAPQFAGWSYRDQGKPAEGFEYCRCLCYLASDLRRYLEDKAKERKLPDYSPREKPKELKETWQVV